MDRGVHNIPITKAWGQWRGWGRLKILKVRSNFKYNVTFSWHTGRYTVKATPSIILSLIILWNLKTKDVTPDCLNKPSCLMHPLQILQNLMLIRFVSFLYRYSIFRSNLLQTEIFPKHQLKSAASALAEMILLRCEVPYFFTKHKPMQWRSGSLALAKVQI